MAKLTQAELKAFLDEKHAQFNQPAYIETDPIQVPHRFSQPENIEIAAFLAATFAWGKRSIIIQSTKRFIQLMDNSPADFVKNATQKDLRAFGFYKHRTFNAIDAVFFVKSLQHIYKNYGGLKKLFENQYQNTGSIKECLAHFRQVFFEIPHPKRTEKHVADVMRGSAAKRLNMMLRWLVRKDDRGVDLGLWSKIPASALYIPLDIHAGNTARKLGILQRKQNDWKAVEELTGKLRMLNPEDPVKYDYSLFGLGVFEGY